jgi:Ser/Thr protein kinase RdoA (MazF antagonist)
VSDSFQGLTPDRVLRVVEERGLRPTGHCSPLVCLENRVYDVRLEGDAHVVVKFYRPGRWSRAALQDEHDFLADLAAAELPVCAPLADADGSTLAALDGIFYGLWERIGGREPDELAGEDLAVAGRLLARVHAVGALRHASARPVLDSESACFAPLENLLGEHGVPSAQRGRFETAVGELAQVLDERLAGVPIERIHGDCHRGNLLRRGDAFWFLDFDDFLMGPAVHDVWMLVPERGPEGDRQREALLAGYDQFADFDRAWLGLIEPLRATRYLKIAGWIASRWEEAPFQSTFPHFGTESYWERELRDLEEQLARIRIEATA